MDKFIIFNVSHKPDKRCVSVSMILYVKSAQKTFPRHIELDSKDIRYYEWWTTPEALRAKIEKTERQMILRYKKNYKFWQKVQSICMDVDGRKYLLEDTKTSDFLKKFT